MNLIEMINFGMHIHNLLKWESKPTGSKPLKASNDENMRDSNLQTKHTNACVDF